MEQLLIYAHTPVFWQCRRLLNEAQLAEKMTESILKTMVSQIDRIESVDHFHKWLGNVTATRCMRKREQINIRDYILDSQDISFPSNELSKAETAQVAQILADSLPEEHRICLILSSCCRVGTKAIAQMTGFGEETVAGYIAEAERGILDQMQVYQSQGVVFAGTLTIAVLLRNAMFGKPNRSAAAAMVRKVLPPIPAAPVQPPKRPNPIIKILLCVVVALILLLILLVCGILMGENGRDAEETTLPSTAATVETTEQTIEPTTEAATESTTQPATEETTIPETTEAIIETTAETEPAQTTSAKPSSTTGKGTGQSNTGNSGTGNTQTNQTGTGNTQGSQSGSGDHNHNLVYMSPYPNFERGPGCESPGWSLFFCTICRDVIAQPDPERRPSLGGHNYVATDVFPPSKYHEGFTTYTCSKCNDAYRADYVPALTPDPETQPPADETQAPAVETQAPVESQTPATEPQAPAADSQTSVSDAAE